MRGGLTLLVVSGVFFSLMGVLVKLAGQTLPAEQIVLARAVVTLVLSAAMLRTAGVSPWGNDRKKLLLRGFLGSTALFCYFWTLPRLPLAEAAIIHHTAPLFVAVMARLWLDERLGGAGITAMVIGLVGVVVVADPGSLGAVALDGTAVVLALVGSAFSASAYVTVRSLSLAEDPRVIVFYFPLVALPLSIPWAAAVWVWPTPLEWLMLLGVGATTQVAQLTMTWGLRRVPASRASAVGYLQVALALGWGLVFFGEIPTAHTLIGAGLIVGSVVIVARGAAADETLATASR